MEDAVTTGVIMMVIGSALAAVGGLGIARRLPSGWMIGIRLPVTTSSDEAWLETHVAAGPWLVLGGIVPFATGIALLVVGGSMPDWSVLAAYAALVVLVALGAVKGVRAAYSVTGTTR
ncbi:SdpI family protein [Arthrobacter sp. JSM 101049]|uniref:SdpI family protein n=1 Tax=Arthrobacter sp. JSM 101049 TaxID=929097 RepID=UPI003568469A